MENENVVLNEVVENAATEAAEEVVKSNVWRNLGIFGGIVLTGGLLFVGLKYIVPKCKEAKAKRLAAKAEAVDVENENEVDED